MASLNSITNSLFSAANENTLALAALKFDFSLMKVEAPAEFAPLGTALTGKRRSDAEDGAVHRSARKLGALFEQLIPSTPKLITAYGLRTSEIIEMPGVNPSGSHRHGPFASFVGADGTAMWAAATSGISALGVYLLSCLLARAWDPKESVSIWVELVDERKREIEEAFRDNHLVSESSLLSTRQDISRQELALWDASTRAWLRSADQAKARQQNQLMLILKNINVPFSGGSSTYIRVIEAWRQAMIGLENLLHGRPQSISNGEVLLALSAWHLFPDLIVLGKETTNVKFKDALVPHSGIGTIGLRPADASKKAIQWSLTLSHLRYYGGPVEVKSTQEFSRVTISQLRVVALGSILGAWRVRPGDILPVATWFTLLWEFLKQMKYTRRPPPLASGFGWLYSLVKASRKLLSSESEGDVNCMKLLKYGQRRAQNFLCENPSKLPPFFGLRNPCILAGLTERFDMECAIRYLREVAKSLGLRSGEAFIYYAHRPLPGISVRYLEYATAVPHSRSSRKRGIDGKPVVEIVHARWLTWSEDPHAFDSRQLGQRTGDHRTLEPKDFVQSRISEISRSGEQAIWITDGPTSKKDNLEWKNPPLLYRTSFDGGNLTDNCPSIDGPTASCSCFLDISQTFEPIGFPQSKETQLATTTEPEQNFGEFCPLIGNWPLGLYVRKEENSLCPEGPCMNSVHKKKLQVVTEDLMLPLVQSDWTEDAPVCKGRLFDYLCCIGNASDEEIFEQRKSTMRMQLLTSFHRLPQDCTWSLHALNVASRVYEKLDGATISLKVVTYPLHHDSWVPRRLRKVDILPVQEQQERDVTFPILRPFSPQMPDRSQTFACIASLESGILNLDPSNLTLTFAMCSENSIYVAGTFLSDPFDVVADYDVRRIVGNIGHSGVCMLVAPQGPKIRPLSDKFNMVNHAPYDLKREDNFKGTSLHLSFTEWILPMDTEGTRTIDQDVYFVESVVSVMDRGEWVADLDVLCVDFESLRRFDTDSKCPGNHDETTVYDYTSLDSWEELLDGPQTVGVFRAHGNWAARLAAVSIISQKGQAHCIGVFGPKKTCLKCMENEHGTTEAALLEFESPLPSFCID